eukprot:6183676-Pleurochrysis_carterae.AAC.4
MFPVHASVVPSQLQGRAARIAQDWLRSGRLSRDALSHVLPDLHVKVRSDPYFMYTAAGSRGAQLLPDAADQTFLLAIPSTAFVRDSARSFAAGDTVVLCIS